MERDEWIVIGAMKDNPFKVFSISNSKAEEISTMMKRKISQKDVTCGNICRFVVKFLKNGWTGCPETMVRKQFPELDIFKETLETVSFYIKKQKRCVLLTDPSGRRQKFHLC